MTGTLTIDTAEYPDGCTATPAAGGSLAADTTYYYRVAAVTDKGEIPASTSFNGTTTAVNKTLNLAWNAVAGVKATGGYKIYRNTSDSWSSGNLYLTAVDTNSFSDDNDPTPSAGVPTTFTLTDAVINLPITDMSLLPETPIAGREGGQLEYLGSRSQRVQFAGLIIGSTAKTELDELIAIRAGGVGCNYTFIAHSQTWVNATYILDILSWSLDAGKPEAAGAAQVRVTLNLVEST